MKFDEKTLNHVEYAFKSMPDDIIDAIDLFLSAEEDEDDEDDEDELEMERLARE